MAEERLAKRQKTTSDFPVTYYDNIAADGHTHQHNGDQIFQGTVYMGSEKSTHQDRGQHLGERNNVVLDSLSFDHMDARYQAIDPSSAQTCRWLVEQPEYKRWRDPAQLEEHHGFLGIKGKAGAGKSTLMRHALDEHTEKKSKDEHVISFFFNARGADLEKSQLSMYRSLIHQMLQRAPWQQASLDPKRIAQARQEWTLPGLRNLFRELILKSKSCPLTCYIDALDECPLEEVIELIEFFEDLGDSCIERSRKCSVCFSSRHYPEVIIQYRELLILEDQPGHAGDIDRYVQRRLEVQNRTVKKDLTAQIRQRARGVFLWVVLTVRILNEAHRRGQAGMLRKCLDDIPQELTALFEDILSRGDTNANLIPLLQWLLYSTRPLKRAELYYALRSVQPFPKPPAEDESEFLDEPAMDRYILESSKGLVEFAKGQHARAQFIHESVRTYFAQIGLTNQLDIKEGDTLDARSHLQLRECCENYLVTCVQPRARLPMLLPLTRSDAGKKLRKQITSDFPFFAYTVESVLFHADLACAVGVVQSAVLLNLDLDLWLKYKNILEERQYRQLSSRASSAYIMSISGCPVLLQAVLSDTTSQETPDEGCTSLLGAAVESDSVSTVRILLAHGADSYANARNHKSCIDLAIEMRSVKIIDTLLHAGVLPAGYVNRLAEMMSTITKRYKDDHGPLRVVYQYLQQSDWCFRDWSVQVLRVACELRATTFVRELLLAGGDVNACPSGFDWCALFDACADAHICLVRALVRHGALRGPALKVLAHACRSGQLDLVNLLLEGAVSPSLEPSALLFACEGGYGGVVNALLKNDAGAAVNAPALMAAVYGSHLDIVRALLAAGADPNIKDGYGTTALTAACKTNDDQIAHALIDAGAEIDDRPCSAVYWASERNHTVTLRKLLERGWSVGRSRQPDCRAEYD